MLFSCFKIERFPGMYRLVLSGIVDTGRSFDYIPKSSPHGADKLLTVHRRVKSDEPVPSGFSVHWERPIQYSSVFLSSVFSKLIFLFENNLFRLFICKKFCWCRTKALDDIQKSSDGRRVLVAFSWEINPLVSSERSASSCCVRPYWIRSSFIRFPISMRTSILACENVIFQTNLHSAIFGNCKNICFSLQ